MHGALVTTDLANEFVFVKGHKFLDCYAEIFVTAIVLLENTTSD